MRIVLAGAGLAAQRCAHALRRRGHAGPITLIGAEDRLPYDRPPLSKERLAGGMDDAALALRPRAWYEERAIELRLGDRVTAVEPGSVRTASGAALPYDRLLVATGARPRTLPGAQAFDNVHTLRSAADAGALAARLRPGARLAIAGGGFIGQEVAATARTLGVEVILLEAGPLPLQRPLGPELGAWLAGLHRAHGVDVRLNARVARLHGDHGTLHAVTLEDGTRIACDALLVAIGVRPDTDWLPAALPAGVLVAGDAAGGQHWEAAAAQGVAAAHRMLGTAPPPPPRPSCWSDQYGIRIQILGDPRGADAVEFDGATAYFIRDGVVRAGLLAGRPRALPALRDQLDRPLPDRRTA